MLGKTAGGLYWMFRNLERAENTARLVEAGLRIALTRTAQAADEWKSILDTAAARHAFEAQNAGQPLQASDVVDFLLRDPSNPSSVTSVTDAARNNARLVRTALTREVWEAVNETWITLRAMLARPVVLTELPTVLSTIRKQSELVRGALHGTMLRNDIFNFCRLGTFVERADNTARILDVKYYVLLPSVTLVGSSLDNVQWETILRSASAERAFGWLHGGETRPREIADFLILDRRMPRSLLFCCNQIVEQLAHLEADYGTRLQSHSLARVLYERLFNNEIAAIFDGGLHEFLQGFLRDTARLGSAIETDYRFNA